MHLAHKLDTIIALIVTLASKCQNSVPHVGNIVRQSAIVCILKCLVDEIHAWLCVRVVFLVEVSFDNSSQTLLRFDTIKVYHFVSFL